MNFQECVETVKKVQSYLQEQSSICENVQMEAITAGQVKALSRTIKSVDRLAHDEGTQLVKVIKEGNWTEIQLNLLCAAVDGVILSGSAKQLANRQRPVLPGNMA